MPSRNRIKQYVAGGIYHLYNRGVEKRIIFVDDQDYRVFLHLLKRALDPQYIANTNERVFKRLSNEIELLAYCLMPNHFHLMVKQIDERGIEALTRSVMTSYTGYFNTRYKRVGSLFQDCYKAMLADSDPYLMHLSRYIHLNPRDIGQDPYSYFYSSYGAYMGAWQTNWLKTEFVLALFGSNQLLDYQRFVEDLSIDSTKIIDPLALVEESPRQCVTTKERGPSRLTSPK